jgi:hypothetical protein
LDAFLASYQPATLPAAQWALVARDVTALVKRAGDYTRVRVQNDVSVLGLIATHLVNRGRPLTLDAILAEDTLLDFEVARRAAGVSDSTRERARGRVHRLQAFHHEVPWRQQRRPEGARIAALPQPGLAGQLAAVLEAAGKDGGHDARAFCAVVRRARAARRGADVPAVTEDETSWQAGRRYAQRHGLDLDARTLAAAVTFEVLAQQAPLAALAAQASLTRADLDLGATLAAALPSTPSSQHRAALRGTLPR